MAKLRARLQEETPHVPLKAAWRRQIRAARSARKVDPTQEIALRSRAAVEQALDQDVDASADIRGLKDCLRRLLASQGDQSFVLAVEVDRRIQDMVSRVVDGTVRLVVDGWPLWMSDGDRAHVLGCTPEDLATLSPSAAAVLKMEIDGLNLGGCRLSAHAELGVDERLPAVPRQLRGRPRARGTRPWLDHIDEVGRISLTPESLAREHAEILKGHSVVIDPFCGCGGDAVAFAEAGLEVFAIDEDQVRLDHAMRNAEDRDLAQRIHFIHGRAQDLLRQIAGDHPTAAVYLDPPWGGVEWDRNRQVWEDLVPQEITGTLREAPQILLKAPRALDPLSLPAFRAPWRIQPAWNPDPSSPAERVLFLRAFLSDI